MGALTSLMQLTKCIQKLLTRDYRYYELEEQSEFSKRRLCSDNVYKVTDRKKGIYLETTSRL